MRVEPHPSKAGWLVACGYYEGVVLSAGDEYDGYQIANIHNWDEVTPFETWDQAYEALRTYRRNRRKPRPVIHMTDAQKVVVEPVVRDKWGRALPLLKAKVRVSNKRVVKVKRRGVSEFEVVALREGRARVTFDVDLEPGTFTSGISVVIVEPAKKASMKK